MEFERQQRTRISLLELVSVSDIGPAQIWTPSLYKLKRNIHEGESPTWARSDSVFGS